MQVPNTPSSQRAGAVPKPAAESFLFKSVLVASALFLTSIVMVEMEFYVSAPGHSLSETEVMMRTTVQ